MIYKDLEVTEGAISNKLSIIHMIGALMRTPSLIHSDQYKFAIEDFPTRFHQVIFGAVYSLAESGAGVINPIDVDQYLQPYEVQYKIFTDNKGMEYLVRVQSMYNEAQFDAYYTAFKKCSLMNALKKQGIDMTAFYNPDAVNPKDIEEQQDRFNSASVEDIIEYAEAKTLAIRTTYGSTSDRVENQAGHDLRALKESLKQNPDVGLALLSPKFTTIVRGQRKGCLFMESSIQGGGKSRRGNGEACHLAIPEYYDVQKKMWVKTGYQERVLMISTELELAECQQMWMAFVAGVPESHIKDGRYLPGEEARVDRAIELIEKSKLFFVSITNYDTDDIINIIKQYHQREQVQYVFFDYLGETLKIVAGLTKKTRVQGLRTDQVLLMLSSALKDVAKLLGIYIWTATQLSGDYKNAKDLDATYLRSAKALADKVDAGVILMPVRDVDRPVIDTYVAHGFELEPNFVINVYKVRAGSYQNIKLYVYFDRATCQMTDCFVTDRDGNLLNVEDTNIEVALDRTSTESFNQAWGETAAAAAEGSFEF